MGIIAAITRCYPGLKPAVFLTIGLNTAVNLSPERMRHLYTIDLPRTYIRIDLLCCDILTAMLN